MIIAGRKALVSVAILPVGRNTLHMCPVARRFNFNEIVCLIAKALVPVPYIVIPLKNFLCISSYVPLLLRDNSTSTRLACLLRRLQ